MTELINFFGYPLFAKIDFVSHSDLFLDSEPVDREMALIVSPMSMDLFEATEQMAIPWGDTSAMDRFHIYCGCKFISHRVEGYGRLFCVFSDYFGVKVW